MSKQNLTRIVGIWSGIVLFSWGLVTMAQDTVLQPDTPLVVRIGDEPAWLTYEGTAGETITISTLTPVIDTAPDTTLEILYPDGQRLDYVDDVVLPDDTVKSDAVLEAIELPVDGNYRIRVDSFNGVSEGEVEVYLTHPSQAVNVITTGDLTIVSGDIPGVDQLTYSLEVTAGSTLSIIARDGSGTLDPVLSVYDAGDNRIAHNDDHHSNDLSLDVLDAQVSNLAIPDTTTLTISVRDYLGRSGTVELVIATEPQTDSD